MNDQIVQCLKKSFPTSHKKITYLLEKLIPLFTKNFALRVRRGKRRMALKKLMAALFYKIKTGCPWRQIPDCFGNWRTIYGWYRRAALANFFGILYEKLVIALHAVNPKLLDDLLFDGSLVMAKNGGPCAKRNPRTQNKSVVNGMFVANKKGLLLNCLIAPGTRHDSQLLEPIFEASKKIFGNKKGSLAHADKGFDSTELRRFLFQNYCWVQIPHREFKNRPRTKQPVDKKRRRIELAFARLKQFRALLVTFNRTVESIKSDVFYRTFVHLFGKDN